MKIKILDINDSNDFAKKDLYTEKTVYATFRIRRNEYYLIDEGDGLPFFIKKSQAIAVTDSSIPNDWVYTKKFIDNYTNPWEGIICLNDLYCPQWMLEDKSFFFEVFLDSEVAQTKFINKI